MSDTLNPDRIRERQREYAAIWGEDVPDSALALDIVREIAGRYMSSMARVVPHLDALDWEAGTACVAYVEACKGREP